MMQKSICSHADVEAEKTRNRLWESFVDVSMKVRTTILRTYFGEYCGLVGEYCGLVGLCFAPGDNGVYPF